jgi:hypothetical protein
MKKVFIVTNEGNTRVISENVLVKDLSEVLKQQNLKVKRKDVEQFVKGAMDEHNGRSMDNTMYTNLLNDYSKSLTEYSNLTPYLYYRKSSPAIMSVTD